MSRRKALIEQSLADLAALAADFSDLAKAQRVSADKQRLCSDKQHETAHKLERLGQALLEHAVQIKGELEMDPAWTRRAG